LLYRVHREELSLPEWHGILDQLKDAGTMYITFTGGEPLVREDFFDIAFYARELGFIISILSNGTLISSDAADKLRDLGPMQVRVSLHGSNADTHDMVTRRDGSFDAMLEGIRLLKERGVPVSWQTLLMDINIQQAAATKALAEEAGVPLTFDYDFVPARSGSMDPFKFTADESELLAHWASSISQLDGPSCKAGGPCKAGSGICAISSNGDVFPCLVMPLRIGNIKQTSFRELWRVNPCEELSLLLVLEKDDFKQCRGCELLSHCKRCLGVAYSETGKLTEPAPSACHSARLKSEFFTRKGVV
jgi:radical SAM protein with 4Fe4S-binding SPASM domain